MNSATFCHVKQLQYADDTVILGSFDKILKCKDVLEKAIEKLIQFFRVHQLKINLDKPEFKIFGSSYLQDEMKFNVGD